MKEVPNLINIGPTNPIQILNQHEIFEDFVCVHLMILLKISMLVLGLHGKDRKSTKDNANISNPKVNIGCIPRTGKILWQVDISLYSLLRDTSIYFRTFYFIPNNKWERRCIFHELAP